MENALWVDVPGFSGPLDRLLLAVQRGDVDVTALPVAELTAAFRRRLAQPETAPSLSEVADFAVLAARLTALKAAALLPGAGPEVGAEEEVDEDSDAGRRLAEYRLFREAVDSLLSAADDGYRSFLGLVVPEVTPMETLRVDPARLVAALRAVVERLPADEPLPLGITTFSVAEMADRLRHRLSGGRGLSFEELFDGVGSRLEAVACFLGLLQLVSAGEARVEQGTPFGPITVSGRA